MTLPPLPNRTILTPDLPAVRGYTFEQMKAYGQQCWDAALEDALPALAAASCDDYADASPVYRSREADVTFVNIRRLK